MNIKKIIKYQCVLCYESYDFKKNAEECCTPLEVETIKP